MNLNSRVLVRSLEIIGRENCLACHIPYLTKFAEHIIESRPSKDQHIYAAKLMLMIARLRTDKESEALSGLRSFEVPFIIDMLTAYIISPETIELAINLLYQSWPDSLAVKVNRYSLQATNGKILKATTSDDGSDFFVNRLNRSRGIIVGLSGSTNRAQGMSWSLFFRSICANVSLDLLVLKDHAKIGYIEGVASAGSLRRTAEKVRSVCKDYQYIVFLGCSMGSYGALLISSLIDRESKSVLLAGPTTLSLSETFEKTAPNIFYRQTSGLEDGEIERLDSIAKNPKSNRSIHYIYAAKEPRDRAYAEHCASLQDNKKNKIVLHEYNHDTHAISLCCLPDGKLISLLRE